MIRLTHRERWLVTGVAALVAGWALFVSVIRPAIERIETLNRIIPEKQREFEELRTKSAQYVALRTKLGNLKKETASGEKGFELLPFLESITHESGLARKVATMKQEVSLLNPDYHEIIVEVRLENLTLEQLVEFLLKIRSSKHFLRIKSLYAKKHATNPNLLDTVMQVSTLKLNKQI